MSRFGEPHADRNRKPSPFDPSRIKLGWTYARLGEEAGLTIRQAWDVLHGKGVTAERIQAIKNALKRGADPDERFALAMAGRRFE